MTVMDKEFVLRKESAPCWVCGKKTPNFASDFNEYVCSDKCLNTAWEDFESGMYGKQKGGRKNVSRNSQVKS